MTITRSSDNGLLRWSAVCVGIDFDRCWVKYFIDGRKVANETLMDTWTSLCDGTQPSWPSRVSRMISGQSLVGKN